MIFSPNKFERLCFSLRNYIQRKTLISPLNAKQRGILRKIHFAEAVFCDSQAVPIDMKEFAGELLSAARILKLEKKEEFCFSVKVKENLLIDAKPFEALILTLAQKSRYLKIFTFRKNLIIESERLDGDISSLIKRLDAFCIYEINRGEMYIIISAAQTSKKTVSIKKEWEQLCDPFSSVNIFLSG